MERKFKILFVTPPYHPFHLADEKIYVVEPIQYEVLASLLDKNHYEVAILDQRLERSESSLLKALRQHRPDFVGFTSWTMHVGLVRRQVAMVKAFNPSIITAVGGHHAGIAPSDFSDANIDYVMMGEAYLSFSKLIERCQTGGKSVSDLPGVAWQENGEFHSNGKSVISREFELDNLPFPDREILGKYKNRYYHLWWKPIAALRTSMGCPSRCSFCNLWRPNRGKYLTWSPEYVVEYLKTLDEPYVLFVDDHFFGDAKRAHRIGELILKSGLKKQYCLYSRSDAIARDPELVELWARAGLKRVRMGLESYSDSELHDMDKQNSIENNDKAIAILKRNDVLTEGLFMVGLDYTEKEFDALGNYIVSRKIEVPNITVATPMPGTEEFRAKETSMIRKNFEYFDFQHAVLSTRLNIKQFCQLYGRLLLKVQRPPIEQIQRIGLRNFMMRVPSFWRYFLSVHNSYRHYQDSSERFDSLPTLPWNEAKFDNPCGARALDSAFESKKGRIELPLKVVTVSV
ncbi:hypothetical protein WS67_20415 [Burkholderia singularis]|uniref:Uncharacterized protein n=1 Tax=Burkholderia singularis TaxID=1503053 RepID=A0A103DXR0_9BURK|nr:radical SAM protein [Burkholderia singularis]KVE24475.1 hypothetical protein WS67_20415 [Burkholderia singularis]